MTDKEHRRQSNRVPLRWEASVVFDQPEGRPVIHSQTQDLSVTGAAIFSEYGDLTGSVVTLLLAHPPRKSDVAPKVLKVRARVVSTARSPGMAQFRHGLSFIRAPGDGLEMLDQTVGDAAAATPRGGPGGAPWDAMLAVPLAGGRLAQLRQLAQAKLAQDVKINPQEQINTRVSEALLKAYRYLKDLAEQLNVVTPPYPKGYAIAGVPEFSGLEWDSGRADFHTREISPTVKLYERVSLRFRLSGKKQIDVAREYPASEKLRLLLEDSAIEYTTQEVRNERGSLERVVFYIPCEVSASLVLFGNFATGKLLLQSRNVSGFGAMEQILAPEAVTDESLDELAGFILGESGRLGSLLLRNA